MDESRVPLRCTDTPTLTIGTLLLILVDIIEHTYLKLQVVGTYPNI